MEKGIFYLICSIVIIAVVGLSSFLILKQIKMSCVGVHDVRVKQIMIRPSEAVTPTITVGVIRRATSSAK